MKSLSSLFWVLFLISCSPAAFDTVKPTTDTTLSPRAPSLVYSTITVTGPSIADGITPTLVTVKLMDQNNTPIVGALLQMTVSGMQNVVVNFTPSNQNGLAYGKIYSSFAEIKTVTAIGQITLNKQLIFNRVSYTRSVIGITSSGNVQRAVTGQKFITIIGNAFAPAPIKDSTGTKRTLPSILGGIVDN